MPMKRLQEIRECSGEVERFWAGPSELGHGNQDVSATDREFARLNTSIDDLTTKLEKATRRINRLLGEKKQLAVILEKRDEQLNQINRELGELSIARPASDTGGIGKLLHSMRPLVDVAKSRLAYFAGRRPTSSRGVATGQRMVRPLRNARTSLSARRDGVVLEQIVIVVALGLDQNEVARLLQIVETDCSSRGLTPLFLVDIDSFEVFRERGLFFEYLPPIDDRTRFDPSVHWNLYLQRRLAIIRRKWEPVRIVSFGEVATKTLALWSESPFEDTPLPAVVGEASKVR